MFISDMFITNNKNWLLHLFISRCPCHCNWILSRKTLFEPFCNLDLSICKYNQKVHAAVLFIHIFKLNTGYCLAIIQVEYNLKKYSYLIVLHIHSVCLIVVLNGFVISLININKIKLSPYADIIKI